MLIRKFLRCKLTEDAKKIVEIIELMEKEDPPYGNVHLYTTPEQRQMIKQSLYKTERIWEMEK